MDVVRRPERHAMVLRKKKTLLDQASDFAESAIEAIDDARKKAAPLLAEAKQLAAEKAAAAAEVAHEGREVAASKLAEIAETKHEPAVGPDGAGGKRKGGKIKRFLLMAGLLAVAGAVAKFLLERKSADDWQSSYVPDPPVGSGTTADATDTASTPVVADDAAGAAPDEAAADAAEQPHDPSTPDDPAEVVNVDDVDNLGGADRD